MILWLSHVRFPTSKRTLSIDVNATSVPEKNAKSSTASSKYPNMPICNYFGNVSVRIYSVSVSTESVSDCNVSETAVSSSST